MKAAPHFFEVPLFHEGDAMRDILPEAGFAVLHVEKWHTLQSTETDCYQMTEGPDGSISTFSLILPGCVLHAHDGGAGFSRRRACCANANRLTS